MIIDLSEVFLIRGGNFSSKRKAIYEKISGTDIHPSAKWVYENLKEEHPDLSLGTVYRNIALFKEQGLIIPVANVGGEERLDATTYDHAHFICESCNTVYDIFDAELTALEQLLRDKNLEITRKSLTFYGKCSKCLKK